MKQLASVAPLTFVLLTTLAAPLVGGCHITSHATSPAEMGVARSSASLEAVVDQPGPIVLDTVVGADWEVARSGLINLEHPKAKQAGLTDGPEPIVVVFHAVRHPTAGLFIVDTGVERALRDDPESSAIGTGLVASVMHTDRMKFRSVTSEWIRAQREPVRGVFLTHLHLDHVSGMRDVSPSATVFIGPAEASETAFVNAFVQPITDSALSGKGTLREWRFAPDPGGAFEGVVDVFGDGSFWALHVPGHTPGSTAFLARTKAGPVLMTGDACHTTWGWDNGVEPGTFSEDQPRSAGSLARLRAFVAKHPGIEVRVGHQLRAARPG